MIIKNISRISLAVILCCSTSWAKEVPAENEPITSQRVEQVLKEAYNKFKGIKEGKNADYIPALGKVNSNFFGIAIVTMNGDVHTIGDFQQPFSIQSISKVFTLAQVLEESGEDAVLNGVGVDATGQAFNSITAIEQYKGGEMNPLVNPGAIATTSMVQGKNANDVWARILNIHSAFAGRSLSVNQEVYKSESDTNQRNQAIGMLMFAYGKIKSNPQQATDLYTRQCSINVTARDLSVMAATLANGGVNPLTRKKVIDQKHVKSILAVMATAGLYDDSGKWLVRTGLPAKSGVGGGFIAVSPGKFGIAAFSPPLDSAGNSLRSQKAIEYISAALGGNPYDTTPQVKGAQDLKSVTSR